MAMDKPMRPPYEGSRQPLEGDEKAQPDDQQDLRQCVKELANKARREDTHAAALNFSQAALNIAMAWNCVAEK